MKRINLVPWLISAALCTALFAGCHKPAAEPLIIHRLPTCGATRRVPLGNSVEARPIECVIVGNGWDVTFMLAAIHGDEPAGTALLRDLLTYLLQQPELMQGRRVILLPIANPDGIAEQTRLNANGVDLNRNFPGDNRQNNAENGLSALSEPEAVAIEKVITKYAPERIVSIHQFTETGPQALSERYPKGCIDYDGPAKDLARQMAKHCDLPVERLGARAGSLGSYCGLTLEVPVITFELPAHAHLLDSYSLWEKYGAALVAAVIYPEKITR